MNRTIKIKRGTGVPSTDILTDGELGFNKENNKLYIGDDNRVHELFGPGSVVLHFEDYRQLEDIDDNTTYFCMDDFDEILTANNGLVSMGINITKDELNCMDGLTSNIQNQIDNMWSKIYPVGSIYISVVNTSPAELFGGSWEVWGTGRVPAGVNTVDSKFATVEYKNGSIDAIVTQHTHSQVAHTHTVGNQSASHTHTVSGGATTTGNNSASHTHTVSGGAHTHPIQMRKSASDIDSGDNFSRGSTTGTWEDWSSIYRTTSATHTHTVGNQSANHTHSQVAHTHTVGNNSASHTHTVSGGATTTGPAGSDGTGKNLQPYITCYMWKRTA